MAGEVHTENLHDTLMPINNITTVQIGDVSSYGDAISISEDKPFVIEKYIKINEQLYAPDDAVDIILANSDTTQNLSDVYPGTLEQVFDDNDNVVGLTGQLGVRYGLSFSLLSGGKKFIMMTTSADRDWETSDKF